MKNTIQLIKNHSSVRSFKDEPLSDEVKTQLLDAAKAGSSSHFIQATSIIEITDKQIKNELADLSNSAPYIKTTGSFFVFIADLYRDAEILKTNHQSLAAVANMEALIAGVVDTTIAGENMALAAEALDLGICFIGGIRNDLQRVSELLKLPKFTVPIFGLTVGIPNQRSEIKPRLPKANTIFQNQYDFKAATDLRKYTKKTAAYYAERETNQQDVNWTQKMQEFFAEPSRQDVADFIREQGFRP
ncbi:oxygen-insensitive NADPH nitroreductase [Lentilactobacillus senioris]|uniref:oxygen-insensitive NADPH nitroreductase n=1 Tax=Lentilactobacillus senioris TaxID=931534 RepID=UPI00227E7F80|nr:oxygen-insensitive NADPH nitroreductase [Lentilactobacillus senioris]MCY9807437.1 oxygen-insensitive NADPH nitroreductase [Lentilactobacillus senioris]